MYFLKSVTVHQQNTESNRTDSLENQSNPVQTSANLARPKSVINVSTNVQPKHIYGDIIKR